MCVCVCLVEGEEMIEYEVSFIVSVRKDENFMLLVL